MYGSDHVSTNAFTRRLCGAGYFYILNENIIVEWDFMIYKGIREKKVIIKV